MIMITIEAKSNDVRFQRGFFSSPRCRKKISCTNNCKTAKNANNMMMDQPVAQVNRTAANASAVSISDRAKPVV